VCAPGLLGQFCTGFERLAAHEIDGGAGRILAEVVGAFAQDVDISLIEYEAFARKFDGGAINCARGSVPYFARRYSRTRHGSRHRNGQQPSGAQIRHHVAVRVEIQWP